MTDEEKTINALEALCWPDDKSMVMLRSGEVRFLITLARKGAALQERVKELETAGRYIKPYLEWTIGPESPGYHPTMPSAVEVFIEVHARTALGEKK